MTDLELFQHIETKLYTAVVSDSLDQLGFRQQAMREYLRPVHPACCFAGWARTVACSDVYHIPPNPYELELEAVDSILPGEVVVVSTNQSKLNDPWGELLSTAARSRQSRGTMIDSLERDVKKNEELCYPVVAAGHKTLNSLSLSTHTEC